MKIFILVLNMFFGQMLDFSEQCTQTVCVIKNIPFGVGRSTVQYQMRYIAPSIAMRESKGSDSYQYKDFKFQGIVQARYTHFVFNPMNQLEEVSINFTPRDNFNSEYPEVINLYFALRERVIESGQYDSVEFVYSFKNPFEGTTEKEAIQGEFTYQEEMALRRDGNGYLNKFRFAKIWSIFKSKKDPDVRLIISVALQEQTQGLDVSVSYTDFKYAQGGCVTGIEFKKKCEN